MILSAFTLKMIGFKLTQLYRDKKAVLSVTELKNTKLHVYLFIYIATGISLSTEEIQSMSH